MICENCEKEFDVVYGSGRFCCSKCARGFSTKDKRKEINEKVSKTLKDKKLEGSVEGQQTHLKCVADVTVAGSIPVPSFNHCLYCGIEINKRNKFCSNECSSKQIIKNTTIRIEAGKCTKDSRIKQYLLEKHGNKCMICGIEEWFGNKVPLVMDHIDGRSSNNVLENLRLVCANCDALLPTYKSKNKNSDRNWRRKNFGM